MNIAFFTVNQVFRLSGGVGNVTDFWGEYFLKNGHNVYMLYLFKQKHIVNNSFEQYQLPNYNSLCCEENYNFALKFFLDKKVDVLINQNAINTSVSRFWVDVCRENNVQVISVMHNTPDYVFYLTPIIKKITTFVLLKPLFSISLKIFHKYLPYKGNYIYKNSDFVVLLSESYISTYLKYYLKKSDSRLKIKSISNPITLTINKVTANFNCKNIVFVGRLSKQKAVDRLLLIWEKVIHKHSDWSLFIIGDGEERDFLERIVEKRALKNVFFEGQTDPIPYYLNSSIMCMTSLYEGFPMVLIEALTFGVIPVIYDTFRASTDIVDDAVNGYLIPDGATNEYANKLSLLMNNLNMRRDFSKQCRLKSAQWNPDNLYLQWLNLFKKR